MRLTKSRDDIMVSGVLGGLGEYLNVDPTFLRIGFVILMFATPLPVIPLYILGAILFPEAPKKDEDVKRTRKRQARPSRKREREYRDFKEYDDVKDKSSSRKEVSEEDWSDF